MKISKTKLAGSLALAGIVLGAVAPTTVQAATGLTIPNGSDTTEKGTNLDLNNNDLVIADEGTDAKAYSEANVQIISGFLTLDMVPDFSFGSVIANGTTGLRAKGVSTIKDDGNSEGILQVSDSRDSKVEVEKGKGLGFTVTAQLAGFKENGSGTENNNFTMNLRKQSLVDANGKTIAGAFTKDAEIKAGADDATPIIDLAKGSYSNGQLKAIFNTNDAAKLKVSDKIGAAGKQTAYSSVITWKLSTTATSTPDAGSHA
ncbi:WxL domain-containing protein [Companilactobacillus mishanensis]|uniref:WxL domain-containing protein n=1 Tax=Companilactobacillus mishanensis TaxID=2486008 RepID=A0ABW9P8W2_9LACO|nr:WxL domain-containing protein [Companilactobacillus mishanensis]MQS45723.1 hypothetical protein [Companilactobacillus mishanensis]